MENKNNYPSEEKAGGALKRSNFMIPKFQGEETMKKRE